MVCVVFCGFVFVLSGLRFVVCGSCWMCFVLGFGVCVLRLVCCVGCVALCVNACCVLCFVFVFWCFGVLCL